MSRVTIRGNMSHRGTPTPIPGTLGDNHERETMSENAPPLDETPQGKGKFKIGKRGWATIIIAFPEASGHTPTVHRNRPRRLES